MALAKGFSRGNAAIMGFEQPRDIDGDGTAGLGSASSP